ncbi:KTSC domain-containing protein [Blautia sp. NSJ-175]|uniref:KTSC domain-containing protein n=1 Tax=Blautia sp. NSJ-175 TaxID=2931396 RepID=UPI001FCFB347|nr:KTSC domain-containing protein [Blautia sp. NSJ-175]MCJ7846138.1 KTSC domain-containing protein [Blautia sp. NSJ-175]
MDINSISWDSTLLKVQFSNGKVMVYENITFSEYQQLLSCLTAADKPSIEAMLNELEIYHVHHVA